MDFNCPACQAAYSYPDEDLESGGVLVTCTQCGRHIRLESANYREDDRTEALLSDDDIEPIPAAPSWIGNADAAPMELSRPSAQFKRPAARPTTAGMPQPNVDPMASGIGRQTSEHSATPEQAPPRQGQAAPATWSWRDLPMAISAIFDLRRFAVTAGAIWVTLILFAALRWLAAWLGAEVEILGTVFEILSWITLGLGLGLLAAVTAYVSQAKIIDGRDCRFGQGIDWVRAWLHSILGTPLLLVGLAGIAIVIEALLGFVGKIPYFGPVFWGFTAPVSAMMSLIAAGLMVTMIYGMTLYVPVVYYERSSPRETLDRLKQLMIESGPRLLSLVIGSQAMILGFMAVTVWPITIISTIIGHRIGTTTMGDHLLGVFGATPDVLKPVLIIMTGPLMGSEMPMGTPFDVGGGLAGLLSTIVPAIVLTIWLIGTQSAGCISYAVLQERQK